MPAVLAGDEVDVAGEYLVAFLAELHGTDIAIRQHFVLKEIFKQFRMYRFIVNHGIHGLVMELVRIIFPVVRVVLAFDSMNYIRCKYYPCFIATVEDFIDDLEYDIVEEQCYNRRDELGDLGVKVQTSKISNPTQDDGIRNVELHLWLCT